MGEPAARARIAIIEDETTLGDVIAELLRDEGYAAVQLAQAAMAHEFVVRQQPDLVLLDLIFEREARGWDILDAHIVDPRTRAIPVILMTADSPAAAARRERLSQLGVPLLLKPFQLSELLDVIAQMLGEAPDSGLRLIG